MNNPPVFLILNKEGVGHLIVTCYDKSQGVSLIVEQGVIPPGAEGEFFRHPGMTWTIDEVFETGQPQQEEEKAA